jgi:hypothetical protein
MGLVWGRWQKQALQAAGRRRRRRRRARARGGGGGRAPPAATQAAKLPDLGKAHVGLRRSVGASACPSQAGLPTAPQVPGACPSSPPNNPQADSAPTLKALSRSTPPWDSSGIFTMNSCSCVEEQGQQHGNQLSSQRELSPEGGGGGGQRRGCCWQNQPAGRLLTRCSPFGTPRRKIVDATRLPQRYG